MKALVASNDPRVRVWVRMALGPAFQILEASDGLEAGRRAEADAPELMIADETMEHYGAFGLVRDVKLTAKPPAVIIVLEREQDVWLAKWSGADRWFVRPLDPFALADAARELTQAPARRAAVRTTKEGNA